MSDDPVGLSKSEQSDPREQRIMRDAMRAIERHNRVRTTLERAYEFTAPARLPQYLGLSADELYANVYDSTAIEAIDNLSSTFVTGFAAPWFPWVQLTPGPLLRGEGRSRARLALEDVNLILLMHFNVSNFYDVLPGFFLDYIMGTGTMKVEPHPSGKGFQFTDVLAERVAIEQDASKQISHHYVPHVMPAWELLEHSEWVAKIRGVDGGSDFLKGCETDVNRDVELLEVNIPTGLRAKKNYHAIILPKPLVMLDDKTQNDNAYITARWGRLMNTPYGDGRGQKAFPDVRTLNKYVELVLENAALSVAGVYMARHDGILNPRNIVLDAGAIIPVFDNREDNPALRELTRSGDLTPGLIIIEKLQAKVKSHFFDDIVTEPGRTPKSAMEVAESAQSKLLRLGAVDASIEPGWMIPLVRRCVDILIRQGELPQGARVDRRMIDIEIVSNIRQAQKRLGLSDQLRFLQIAQGAAPSDPTAGALPDVRGMLRDIAEVMNIKETRLRSDQQLNQMADNLVKRIPQMLGAEDGSTDTVPQAG